MPKDMIGQVEEQTEDPFFAEFRDWFEREDIRNAIKTAGSDTKSWLLTNLQSINSDGKVIVEPWFNRVAFMAELPNKMAEGERHYTLDIKAYEHGVGYFLRRLNNLDVYDIELDKGVELVFLRSAELNAWLRYLVRNSWVNKSINLKEFRDTGDFHWTTPQSHARKKLQMAAALGVAIVKNPKGLRSYSIEAGPVAKTFYEDVWYPITTELRADIKKWSE